MTKKMKLITSLSFASACALLVSVPLVSAKCSPKKAYKKVKDKLTSSKTENQTQTAASNQGSTN
ncbi:hypothetical protein [Mycoplasma sp. 392]